MREALARIRPDVVFGNEREWEAIGDVDAACASSSAARAGSASTATRRRGDPSEVVDTTGAGDALAAGFLVGGPQLALETAARCVAQVGAMP